MRILFVVPNAKGAYQRPGFPHVGVGYLMAVLRGGRHTPKVIDLRLGHAIQELDRIVTNFKPDLIAITIASLQHDVAYDLVHYLKNKNIKIVVGGPHVSIYKKKILEDTPADFAVVGEGEFTLLELCNGTEPSKIKGLIWRDGKKIIINEQRGFISDLDALPYPAYDLFEMDKYLERKIPIVSSRGCPFSCIYCSIKQSMGQMWRPRSAKNVVEEIIWWYNQGYDQFQFTDDNFTLDLKRASKICDLIIKLKLRIRWDLRNGIRVDRVNTLLLHRMKKAGCFYVAFGIESANKEVLAAIKKNIRITDARNAVLAAKKAGLKVGAFFIIGHPLETYATFLESYNFARSLPLDEVRFYNMVPYPGTELYAWIKNNGHFLYADSVYLNSVDIWSGTPVFETSYFSASERKKAFQFAESFVMLKLYQRDMGFLIGFLVWIMGKNVLLRRAEKNIFLFIRKNISQRFIKILLKK